MSEIDGLLKKFKRFSTSNKKAIKNFIDIESDYDNNLFNSIFPGWKYKINANQFKLLQKILFLPNYKTKSNKFIFDIESNKYGTRKIVQIAYYVIDSSNNLVDKDMYYVFNEGVYSDYYNKIKYPTLKEFGVSPQHLHNKLCHVIAQCDTIIGHNIISFDCNLIKKYFGTLNLTIDLSSKICFDTMKESRYIANLKNKNGGSKSATLTELSDFFNVEKDDLVNFHDALYDVHITYLCYLKMVQIMS